MKGMKRVLIPLGVVVVLIALVMAFAQTGSQKNNEPAQSQAGRQNNAQKAASDKDIVIGYLQGRDSVVTIIRGPKGTVYTVKNKNGKILAAKLSENELRTKYPAIYDQVKNGRAGNDATIRKPSRLK